MHCCGLHQHGAGGSAGLTQLIVGIGDRRRAAGALDRAECGIVVELRIRGRVFSTHLRPVGVEFLGHDGCKAGERPLPELDMFRQNCDGVVGCDPDEGVGREYRRRGRRRGCRLRTHLTRQGEKRSPDRSGPAASTGATDCVDASSWRQPSIDLAASWMAARMRTYVAHRQMLPFMARSMSVSDGLLLLSSSATALMIWPDWQ